jgi:hypothetical protein
MKIQSMVIVLAGVAFGAVGYLPPAAADQVANPVKAKQSFDAAARKDVVDEIVKLMTDEYVFPDAGRRAAGVVSC